VTLALARLRNQRLLGPALPSPGDVVRWLGAVQSQDYVGASWGVSLRCGGLTAAAFTQAFNAGQILRTHVMRPTWHFVAPEDIRWLQALTSPRVHKLNGFVYRSTELDEATCRRADRIIARTLRDRQGRTRSELAAALERGGVPASGLRLAYLVMRAELNAVICSGPMRGKQHTYMLLDERVPAAPALERDEALAKLALRYFRSHGPASAHDFSWWSGLTLVDARAGAEAVKSLLDSREIDGRTYWGPSETLPPATRTVRAVRKTSPVGRGVAEPLVHLLPNYDEHVVAYRDHSHSLDPATREALRTRGNAPLAVHLVVRDGLIVGGWRRTFERGQAVVTTQLLTPLKPRETKALQQSAAEFGRFLEMPVKVQAR
jgi:hypothetical protein